MSVGPSPRVGHHASLVASDAPRHPAEPACPPGGSVLEDLQILGQGEFRVAFADRMTPAEIIFNLGVGFDRPGRYEFRLHANNKWVASKSLSVVQMAPPGAS